MQKTDIDNSQDNNMITHYGLFWLEDSVFWGRQKKQGELLGRIKPNRDGQRGAPTKKEREQRVENFRDYVGIYCLYGGGELIYVGEAGLGTKSTLFKRLHQHRTRKGDPLVGLWDKFSWFGCKSLSAGIERKRALAQLEAILIAITNPRFNKQSGTFAKATRVFQVTHPEADGDIAQMLKGMEERMERVLQEIKETVTPKKK